MVFSGAVGADLEFDRDTRGSSYKNAKLYTLEVGTAEAHYSRSLSSGEHFTLGSGRCADLRIDDALLAAEQCSLRVTDGGVEIEDLTASRAIHIGGARLTAALLSEHSAEFVIGRTSVALHRALPEELHAGPDSLPNVIGSSASMRRVAFEVRRHAKSRVPVLLLGESGSGKEVIARALHDVSGRRGAYVPVNLSALPAGLVDSELVGHQRGAFTGALASRDGAFVQADGGTLFLDEIGELEPAVQAKLLRIVEGGEVRPIGAARARQVDTRIVSATLSPLDDWALSGRFRYDLFQRLSYGVVRLPPLRRRKSDIPELARHLLRRLHDGFGDKLLSTAALSRLVAYRWPGNVRELMTVLYRAAVASDESEIQARHIQFIQPQKKRPSARACVQDVASLLEKFGGNVSAAARAAELPRTTFRARLRSARAVPK